MKSVSTVVTRSGASNIGTCPTPSSLVILVSGGRWSVKCRLNLLGGTTRSFSHSTSCTGTAVCASSSSPGCSSDLTSSWK